MGNYEDSEDETMENDPDAPLGDEDSIYSGTSITLPQFVKWNMKSIYDGGKNIVDHSTMVDFEGSHRAARSSLQLLTDKINEYERLAREAKVVYERAFRREFLGSVEKTENLKKARAALKCEELENEWITKDQLMNELIRASHAMRQELQALTTVANNLRQQLKL